MAKRKRKRKSRKQAQEYPGWMWMLFGLAIGLSVAFAIYRKGINTTPPATTPAVQEQVADPAPPEPAAQERPDPEPPESRFTFYDMLPRFEVVIPEEEADVSQDSGVRLIEEPGVYVLQAGSFALLPEADRRRAELALLGIESQIQRVSIDEKTYHRVRIGPLSDLDKLNLVREQLRQADIDVLRIRLGD